MNAGIEGRAYILMVSIYQQPPPFCLIDDGWFAFNPAPVACNAGFQQHRHQLAAVVAHQLYGVRVHHLTVDVLCLLRHRFGGDGIGYHGVTDNLYTRIPS